MQMQIDSGCREKEMISVKCGTLLCHLDLPELAEEAEKGLQFDDCYFPKKFLSGLIKSGYCF